MVDSNSEQEQWETQIQSTISGLGDKLADGVMRGLEQSELLGRLMIALEAIQERLDHIETDIRALKSPGPAPTPALSPSTGSFGMSSVQTPPKIDLPRMEPILPSQHSQVVTRRPRVISRPTVTYRGSSRLSAPSTGTGHVPFSAFSGPPAPIPDVSAGQTGASASGICSVPGCDKPSRAKGLCSAHYQRQRYQERKTEEVASDEAVPPSPEPVEPPTAVPEVRSPVLTAPPPVSSDSPPPPPPRKEGGTRGIFAVLYEDKGRKLLAGLVNQMKYDRSDLVMRLNKMHEGMPGVPLEEEDVLRAIHYHQLGDVLKKRESEVICRHLEKLQGSLGKTAQRLRIEVDTLKARIDELGLQGDVSRIRNSFREQILEHQNFNQRLDLALTREKYLVDLGIEAEVDESLRRELNAQVDKLSADVSAADAGQTIRAALSLDEERFRRLVRRFGLAERFGLTIEPPAPTMAENPS
jgi:hypothetical protein